MKKLLHTLYVTEPDVSLHLAGEAICIIHSTGEKDHIPLHLLESIIDFSYGEFTQNLLSACAKRGIGVYFLNQYGRLRYQVSGPLMGNVLLRKKQYLFSERKDDCLKVAKQMICAKIKNEIFLLTKFRHNHPIYANAERDRTENALQEILEQARNAQTLDQLRGYEGIAGREYFKVFDTLILSNEETLRFKGRNRRPPKDPCNVLLSFLYKLLEVDCIQALTCAGLDPYVGFLHNDRPGKPSLALDMMEEFRPLIADRLVLKIINLNVITSKMFRTSDSGGVIIDKEGQRILLQAWNQMKQTEILLPKLDAKVPRGLLPHLQAQQMARFLRGTESEYSSIQGR